MSTVPNTGNKENLTPETPSLGGDLIAAAPAPKAGKKKSTGPSTSTKAVWKSSDSALLIENLIKERDAGHQSDSGFKPVAWVSCALALKGSEITGGGAVKSKGSCKDHFKKVSTWHSFAILHPI